MHPFHLLSYLFNTDRSMKGFNCIKIGVMVSQFNGDDLIVKNLISKKSLHEKVLVREGAL